MARLLRPGGLVLLVEPTLDPCAPPPAHAPLPGWAALWSTYRACLTQQRIDVTVPERLPELLAATAAFENITVRDGNIPVGFWPQGAVVIYIFPISTYILPQIHTCSRPASSNGWITSCYSQPYGLFFCATAFLRRPLTASYKMHSMTSITLLSRLPPSSTSPTLPNVFDFLYCICTYTYTSVSLVLSRTMEFNTDLATQFTERISVRFYQILVCIVFS